MNDIGFGIGLLLIAIVSYTLWRRTTRSFAVTRHLIRCPISSDLATIAVTTDLAARSRDQYVAVESCSLLSDAAIGVPARVGYLSDAPPCKVRLDAVRSSAVYTGAVRCPQSCVFVLNMSATPGAPHPVLAMHGADNAIELADRVCGNARSSRMLRSWAE